MTNPLILPSSNGATMFPFDGQAQRTSSSPSCGACGGGTALTGAAAVDAAGGVDAGTEATTGGGNALCWVARGRCWRRSTGGGGNGDRRARRRDAVLDRGAMRPVDATGERQREHRAESGGDRASSIWQRSSHRLLVLIALVR